MLPKISRPTLLLDEAKTRNNIRKMTQKAMRHGVKLSPHFKTHQSVMIGKWFQEEGIDAATASSVSMAKYFIDNGWQNLTIVFPLNVREIDRVNDLAGRSELTVLIDAPETISAIDEKLDYPVKVLIEIDSGYHRTGVGLDDFEQIQTIIDLVVDHPNLFFSGFYCHSGDTYKCHDSQEIEEVHARTIQALNSLRQKYSHQFPELILSLGDTPACSITENFEGIDVIRPGNFVFYDLMQVALGSCNAEEVSIAMACPAVFKNPERGEITVYGGGVHFSKEALEWKGKTIFGQVVNLQEGGWSDPVEECYLKSISQEHGVLKVTDALFDQLSVGDMIGILPVHSCMTADLMGEYLTLDGKKIDHLSGPKFRD